MNICLFDRLETEGYQKKGHHNVFHLPLAVDTNRLDAWIHQHPLHKKSCGQLPFMGKIYDSPLEQLLRPADDYCKEFIQGNLQSQMRV